MCLKAFHVGWLARRGGSFGASREYFRVSEWACGEARAESPFRTFLRLFLLIKTKSSLEEKVESRLVTINKYEIRKINA
jgi:hypothetical protein